MEALHRLVVGFPYDFMSFAIGILCFQLVYIFSQFIMTRRLEYLWYFSYLAAILALLPLLKPEIRFLDQLATSDLVKLGLLFSAISYWLFWKSYFEIGPSDKVINRLITIAIGLQTIPVMGSLLAVFFPAMTDEKNLGYDLTSNALYLLSLWLFWLTYRLRQSFASVLVIVGALLGNIIQAIPIVHYQVIGNSSGGMLDLYFLLVSYIVETILFSVALAYKTQAIFRQNRQLELGLAKAQMTALRAQMNPHFMHNCLNAINRFILNHENDAAAHYLSRFARLIRLVLNSTREDSISLSKELEGIRLYLEMENLRFGQRLTYTIELEPDLPADEIHIPPMLIQPLVENAIYHGLLPSKGRQVLDIRVGRQAGGIYVTVTDNGIGRRAAAQYRQKDFLLEKPLGLQIVRERLESIEKITQKRTALDITDRLDARGTINGTIATLFFAD